MSFDRYNGCSSSCVRRSSPRTPLETKENVKEWEDARCPVCMDHPHNVVLLICSSQGCRPYICDTSYQHSNCLDQFCKSRAATSVTTPLPEESMMTTTIATTIVSSESTVAHMEEVQTVEEPISSGASCEDKVKPKLLCPHCWGEIKEWKVIEPVRRFMDAKSRSCACETCEVSGTYMELRQHARAQHPLIHPSEADPERQRRWRRVELQRGLGKLLSTQQSWLGGEDIILPDDGDWLTAFLFARALRSGNGPRSSSRYSASRTRAQLSVSRRPPQLRGETHDGEIGSSSRDGGSVPYRRRS